jgi:hypothetical protein
VDGGHGADDAADGGLAAGGRDVAAGREGGVGRGLEGGDFRHRVAEGGVVDEALLDLDAVRLGELPGEVHQQDGLVVVELL